MKRSIYLLIAIIALASCGGKKTDTNKVEAKLEKLKKDRTKIDKQIQDLESQVQKDVHAKPVPVYVESITPVEFNSYVEVQGQVTGDEDVTATPQTPGVVKSISVHAGQHVRKGQVLATLDAAAIDQQIQAQQAQLNLVKQLYEKQKKLWAQNIGTEVQLLQAKTQYESAQKGVAALQAQRDMYRIVSPIDGTVDEVNVKTGDVAAPGSPNGIHVVSFDKLKVTASLGENYLGKVKTGDHVHLIFPDIEDTLQTTLTYVSQAVNPVSRAFQVEIRLGRNKNLHPNMSCKMQIINYQDNNALIVPVNIIQKSADGDFVYVANGDKAKAVPVTTGRNSNGKVEILSGLKPGDKIITQGYEELDNNQPIEIQH